MDIDMKSFKKQIKYNNIVIMTKWGLSLKCKAGLTFENQYNLIH